MLDPTRMAATCRRPAQHRQVTARRRHQIACIIFASVVFLLFVASAYVFGYCAVVIAHNRALIAAQRVIVTTCFMVIAFCCIVEGAYLSHRIVSEDR
jgi:hypothetical protein